MSSLFYLTREVLKSASEHVDDFVIPGLSKGEYGFIIGTGGVGKGYLCLSLAYELASGLPFIGLKKEKYPLKVLYWPAEEKRLRVLKRIAKNMKSLEAKTQEMILSNLIIYDKYEPICAPNNMFGSGYFNSTSESRKKLIQASSDVDLLIIDTAREAIGMCKEVENDLEVKNALIEIARESNTAVLVTHHPTKEISKGKDTVTSMAGSGLSTTQSTSRYALYLDVAKNEQDRLLTHTKKNNLDQDEIHQSTVLSWDNNSLIHNRKTYRPSEDVEIQTYSELVVTEEDLEIAKKSEENLLKPSTKDMSKIKVPESELAKSKKIKDEKAFLSDDEAAEYQKFLDAKSKS